MIRNLKALGLALVAVFAIGAITASAALAVEDHFTATKASALLTGTSTDNIFKITGGPSFECTTSQFTATGVNNSTEVTVDPSYTGRIGVTPHGTQCTGTPIGNVTIDMNSCDYDLTGKTTGSDGGLTDATISVTCTTTGDHIVITGPIGCRIKVPAQTPTSGGVTYVNKTNHTGGSAIEVKATSTGITYTSENCVGVASEGNDSDYTGTVVVTGYEDTEGLPTPITEGAQIPVEIS